jgi:hypothetical protein
MRERKVERKEMMEGRGGTQVRGRRVGGREGGRKGMKDCLITSPLF